MTTFRALIREKGDGDLRWVEVGDVTARSKGAAEKQVLGSENIAGTVEIVLVPIRSWQPETYTAKQDTVYVKGNG